MHTVHGASGMGVKRREARHNKSVYRELFLANRNLAVSNPSQGCGNDRRLQWYDTYHKLNTRDEYSVIGLSYQREAPVACSTWMGKARASVSGTSNTKKLSRYFFCRSVDIQRRIIPIIFMEMDKSKIWGFLREPEEVAQKASRLRRLLTL